MYLRRFLITVCAAFFLLTSFSQTHGNIISGQVTDKASRLPIQFATIQILRSADSTLLAGTASDEKGKFNLTGIVAGNYLLVCTYVSHTRYYLPINLTGEQTLNVGNIQLLPLPKNMKEVVVTTTKSTLNTAIDRKVYNVDQDIMAQSGSASDILKNIPSVEVDIDGNVSLRGSDGVLILINGKPSPLMGNNKADVLQQLPANSIERIEVITNPSARFKPDGTSGIINIVMKKNIKSGWNGTVIGNAGNKDRYSGSANLNYKQGKVTAFGSYGYRHESRNRVNTINRQYLDDAGQTSGYYNELNSSPVHPVSNLATLGFEYAINEHNSFGLSGNYSNRKLLKRDVVNKYFYDPNHMLLSQYNRLRYDPESEIEKDGTIFFQHNFAKEDHEVRLELNLSKSDEVEDNHYTNVYNFSLAPSSFDNTLITQKDNQKHLTIDYSNPLSESSKLEIGYDGTIEKIDPVFFGEYFDTGLHKFITDVMKSNKFIYNQDLQAVYGTYQRSYGAFGYSAGIRLEQSFTKANLVTKDSVINNQYFKIYPTLHLAYKLKKGELQLNYSRRVHRPESDDLNPFPEYRDPRNLQAGNPKLLPEIIHSVEFGYKWQDAHFSFVPSLYYRYKEHGFTSIIVALDDSTLLTTKENLSNDQSAGLELIFSAKAGKFFTSNLSSNFFYNTINGTDLGFTNKKSIISMSATFNSTFILAKNTMLQVSSNFRSARLTPQGKTYGTIVFNAGMRQDLLKKKLTVTLTGSDLFKTLKQKTELNTPFLKQLSVGTRDARIIYLGVAYHFGKTTTKKPDEKLQFDNNL
ncbi:MAG: TonB-dependent receptor [Chitinophagaceae bacterium]|nr:TonB-dependent receptor [Chitinophagaceae bacterium]